MTAVCISPMLFGYLVDYCGFLCKSIGSLVCPRWNDSPGLKLAFEVLVNMGMLVGLRSVHLRCRDGLNGGV
jgi:hypothetical protein